MIARLKLETLAYHRNGIFGEGFYVLTFTEDGRNMVATVFYNPDGPKPLNPRVAVFDRDLLAKGEIGFGVNSWRGDEYAAWCHAEIDRHTAEDRVT